MSACQKATTTLHDFGRIVPIVYRDQQAVTLRITTRRPPADNRSTS